jgi:hypothetical protein
MDALCIDPPADGTENAGDPMPTLHRRAFLTAAAILAAPRPAAARPAPADAGRADPGRRALRGQNFLRYAREVWGA